MHRMMRRAAAGIAVMGAAAAATLGGAAAAAGAAGAAPIACGDGQVFPVFGNLDVAAVCPVQTQAGPGPYTVHLDAAASRSADPMLGPFRVVTRDVTFLCQRIDGTTPPVLPGAATGPAVAELFSTCSPAPTTAPAAH